MPQIRKLLLILFSVVLCSTTVCMAQTEWHAPTRDVLGISLRNLKESANSMRQRNQWLRSEIRKLERSISQNQKTAIEQVQPIGVPSSTNYSVQSTQNQGYMQRSKPVSPVVKTQSSEAVPVLQKRLNAKSNRGRELERDIIEENRKIQMIESKLRSVRGPDPDHSEMNREIARKLEVSRVRVEELQDRMQLTETEYGDALGQYNAMKAKNDLLKQKKVILEGHIKQADADREALSIEIKRLESQNQTFIEQIQNRIVDLRSKGHSLEKVLDKANNTIVNNNLAFDISEQEIDMLRENLSFISRENEQLKGRYSRLESDLGRLKETGKK